MAAGVTGETRAGPSLWGLCWGLGGRSEVCVEEGTGFCGAAPEGERVGVETAWCPGKRVPEARSQGPASAAQRRAELRDRGAESSRARRGGGGRCAGESPPPDAGSTAPGSRGRGRSCPPQSVAPRAPLLEPGSQSWSELVWREARRRRRTAARAGNVGGTGTPRGALV